MEKKMLKKLICLVLVFGICLACVGGLSTVTVSAVDDEEDESSDSSETDDTSVEEIREKLNSLQSELSSLNDKISSAKSDASAAKTKSETYSARKAIVQEQIDSYEAAIEIKQEELAAKQHELVLKQAEYDEMYELFKQRVKAMYMNNNVSMLSLILGSRTFSEFLVAAKTQSTISKHDTELVDKLDKEAKEIEAEEKIIEQEVETLESDLDALDMKYQELAALIQEADAEVSEAEALQLAYADEYEETEEAFKETLEELAEYMGNGITGNVGEDEFLWPVPYTGYITSKFGYRYLRGVYGFHGGIDISAWQIFGKPIVASKTGQVVRARYYTTGYGYHVMIDHGDNNWTVYGHMSEIAVSEGEWVVQGQVIGYVGSTGNSTGPHLHFEIRLDGEKVDPLPYVEGTRP